MAEKNCCSVNLISMRMHGHASAAGYDRLAEFLDARVIHPVSQWTFTKRAICRIFRCLIKRSGSTWYHRDSLYSELFAAQKWFRKGRQIFHFLYGENNHRYLGLLNSPGSRNSIVCTYHLPPERFCKFVRDQKHISRLDAIIVLSTVQLDFFSDLIGPERVFCIPHGIDVDYFKPEKNVDSGNGDRCLFVGTHLRDFETMAQTAFLLQTWKKHFRLTVVTSPKFHHYFRGIDNVELYSGISDKKLLSLYKDSYILALPLLDGTANNSLLEAMACGLPIVSTDLPAVRDYVNDACALLTPKSDPLALAEAINTLQENAGIRERMALASRSRSLDFSWQKIASKTRAVYESVCS